MYSAAPWYRRSWASTCADELVNMNGATDQVLPPSVVRTYSVPPAITTLGSTGETTIVLLYHTWLAMKRLTLVLLLWATPGRSFHVSPASLLLKTCDVYTPLAPSKSAVAM